MDARQQHGHAPTSPSGEPDPNRDSLAPDSRLPDTDAIDSAWMDNDEAPTARRPPLDRPRDTMPTLLDEDPLQYDAAEGANERARDRMPTLHDEDPLQYDVDPDEK